MHPALDKWRRFQQSPAEDRALLLRAALLLLLTRIGLRSFGFLRWKEMIEEFSMTPHPRALPAHWQREMAGRAARAIGTVERHGPARKNCLERSMALWWLLWREGVEGELHVGARKQGERFEAHAWVEWDGQVLNDNEQVHEHYARFHAPIAAAAPAPNPAGKTISA